MTDEDGPGGDDDPEAPLADLAERVEARRDRTGEDRFEASFAEPEFEEVDAESVWEESPEEDSAFGAIGRVIEEGEETHVVSKRNFCERCRYLSSPPEVRCTHGGTEIREFVDKDHVRVHACPVVEERGLGDGGPSV